MVSGLLLHGCICGCEGSGEERQARKRGESQGREDEHVEEEPGEKNEERGDRGEGE